MSTTKHISSEDTKSGAEGSRTPVRKTSFQAFYVRRLCFNLVWHASAIKLEPYERNKFPEWLFLSDHAVAWWFGSLSHISGAAGRKFTAYAAKAKLLFLAFKFRCTILRDHAKLGTLTRQPQSPVEASTAPGIWSPCCKMTTAVL